MTNAVYAAGNAYQAANGWSSLDVRVLLLDAAGSYIFDESHDSLDALNLGSNELNTVNYSQQALSGESVIAGSSEADLDANDIGWTALGPNSGGPAVQAVVVYFYVDGSGTNDIPYLYLSDGFPKQVNGEDFTLHWNLSGLVRLVPQVA